MAKKKDKKTDKKAKASSHPKALVSKASGSKSHGSKNKKTDKKAAPKNNGKAKTLSSQPKHKVHPVKSDKKVQAKKGVKSTPPVKKSLAGKQKEKEIKSKSGALEKNKKPVLASAHKMAGKPDGKGKSGKVISDSKSSKAGRGEKGKEKEFEKPEEEVPVETALDEAGMIDLEG